MDKHDQKNFSVLSSIIKDGDLCIDVGANIGIYSKFLLGLGAKLYSIELDPNTCQDLKNALEDNATVINAAISSVDGEIEYFKGEDSCRNNIIGHDMNFHPNSSAGKIESKTLNTLFSDVGQIKLLKIDIEGAELSALYGAGSMIRNVEYLLLECHLDSDWPTIRDLLLNVFNFKCLNLETNEEINMNSSRPYQCFCKRNV